MLIGSSLWSSLCSFCNCLLSLAPPVCINSWNMIAPLRLKTKLIRLPKMPALAKMSAEDNIYKPKILLMIPSSHHYQLQIWNSAEVVSKSVTQNWLSQQFLTEIAWNFIAQFQKISILQPQKGLESWGVGGSVRPKHLKNVWRLIEISRRVEGLRKIPSMGEVWIFSGTTHYIIILLAIARFPHLHFNKAQLGWEAISGRNYKIP